MIKRIISVVLLVTICFSLSVSAAEANKASELNFTDVMVDAEEYDAVLYLSKKGIINGKSKTEFCPEDNLKREEFAKILTKSFNLKGESSSVKYSDVADGAWYASSAKIAGATGLMIGVSEDAFGVGMELTREDLAVVLKRFLDKNSVPLKSDSMTIYADGNEISDYAKEAVQILSSVGIMDGKENNLWQPKQNVTRAEAAVAVYNALLYEKDYLGSLGRYGGEKQYYEPYDVSTDDRLAESMPAPFDVNSYPAQELVSLDFESDDFGGFKKASGFDVGVTIGEGLGFDGSKGLKIDLGAAETVFPTFKIDAKPGQVDRGDSLILTAKFKLENPVVMENTVKTPMCKPMVSVWDDSGKWLTESDRPTYKVDTNGWIDYQAVKTIPAKLNDLNPPEYLTIGLSGYARNFKEGTAYFDDLKVSVVKFEPMHTVLMTPNYKGIIKGEDGVGDIALRVYVDDCTDFYDLNNLKYKAVITDDNHNVLLETESDTVTNSMDVYFSSASLPMGGDYYLESILSYKDSGEILQEQEWTLHKKEKDFTTAVDIDKYGRVVHNGVAKLPISVYDGVNYNHVQDIIDRGCFDVWNYNGFGWSINFNEEHQKMIKNLEDNDVAAVVVLGNTTMDSTATEVTKRSSTQIARRGLIEKKVNNYKDLPNMFGYYIFDEMDAVRYSNEMTWTRKIVEKSDLDHPTLCAIDRPVANFPGIYSNTSDFLGYDPYPITGKDSQDIGLVYDRINIGRITNPNRPVYAILQGFIYDTRGDLRAPLEQEFRNMAFQALCAGSCMLDMYNRGSYEKRVDPTAPWEELWDRYTKVFTEIQNFEPIIISVLPAPHYEIEGEVDWLKTMSRRYDGKSYLFTVNTDTKARTAKIHLDGAKAIKGLYSGKIYEADSKGWFEIDLEKYGTEVFEYEQADYKSSHAELIRFGVSDCVITDSETETPEIIISKDKKEVEFSAAVSDFAKFYINGKQMDTAGKIKVSGLSKITVKVVSEDGRFETVKTYKINRK